MIADYCIKKGENLVAVCSYRFYGGSHSIMDVQNFVGRLNKLEVPTFGGTRGELVYNKVKESLSKGCLGLGVSSLSGLQLLFIDNHLGI